MKTTYFDLTVRDLGQARAFFERILGWRFEKFQMPASTTATADENAE